MEKCMFYDSSVYKIWNMSNDIIYYDFVYNIYEIKYIDLLVQTKEWILDWGGLQETSMWL